MRIKLEVHPKDVKNIIDQLFDQMGYYNARHLDGGILCMMGEQFNVYVYPQKNAFLKRMIEILPKAETI